MTTIGLDVSTTFTGITILDDLGAIILCDAIKFPGKLDTFEKADKVSDYLADLKVKPTRLVIEEPLLGFQKGGSSATTITSLFRFNGMISYIARGVLGISPKYTSASHARKICGLKMQQKKICGKTHKEQTAKYMLMYDLSHINWPKKKNGIDIQPWVYDAIDSYVIAKCGFIEKL
jgi:hypothetical protein